MKDYRRILTILVLMVCTLSAQIGNEEFRSIWVITWDLMSSSNSVEQNKERCRTILDHLQAANMNAVIWHVRQGGTAYYNSQYEPWGSYAGGSDPGYDPLAYAIEEAHKRGMEVHAWFNTFQCASTAEGAPAQEHPEWISRDRDGNPMTSSVSLSPGMAAVREYTVNVAMEIVRNYDIDGIHLDYVRYNEYSSKLFNNQMYKPIPAERMLDGMITQEALAAMKDSQSSRYLYDADHPYSAGIPDSANGAKFSSWESFWRSSVTEFVHTLQDSIKSQKPWVRLSAAVLGRYNWGSWQGYGDVYQDAALWFNKGYVDQLMPMHYHWTSASGFTGMLQNDGAQSWYPYIGEGIDAGRLYSVGPGSYIFDESNVWNNHPSVVNACRGIEWTDGFQFFSYSSWQGNRYWDEAGHTFFQKKTRVRHIPGSSPLAPAAPALSIQKIDSMNYELTVTPPSKLAKLKEITEDSNYWIMLYRSEDATIDPDSDAIVGIKFGADAVTYTETFDGSQNFAGAYYYGATISDRYQHKSAISTVVNSDPLPTLPPSIIDINHADSDTLDLVDSIIILFSKDMDTASVENALEITPSIALNLRWRLENGAWGRPILSICPQTQFDFATNYTLTLSVAATDQLGLALDAGLTLHFTSENQDITGPAVTSSYPQIQSSLTNFEPDDVINFMFNETLDPATVDATSVMLSFNNQNQEIDIQLSEINRRSLISLKTNNPLLPSAQYEVQLKNSITDSLGNPMQEEVQITFSTAAYPNTDTIMLDDFKSTYGWQDPDYSGSTIGTISAECNWGYDKNLYLPSTGSKPINRRSAYMEYSWDPAASEYLIREYLSSGTPQTTEFDSSYTLQTYIYGDSSMNQFRFSIRGKRGTAVALQVSQWTTIDWYGWRLVEWDLFDRSQCGDWLGDHNMSDVPFRMDSYQLTRPEGGALSGKIYFDNLRCVQKSLIPVGISDSDTQVEKQGLSLQQNYPNPFNPTTTISFHLNRSGFTKLTVYDLIGREVARLIEENLSAGTHSVEFNGANISSGVYLYQLTHSDGVISRSMMLVK